MNELARMAPIIGAVLGGALVVWLATTPIMRRRNPAMWREVGQRIGVWVGIAALVGGSLWAGRVAWIIVMGIVALLAFREYARAVGLWSERAFLAVGYLFLVVLHLTIWWPYADFFPGPGWYGLFMAMPVWGVAALFLVPVIVGKFDAMLQRIALMVLAMLYFGFFLSHFTYMRNLSGGLGLVLWMATLVAANDVSAFLWGKAIGRHKLRATLSPGKTWEGAAGSAVTVIVIGYASRWLVPQLETWQTFVLSAVISVGAVVGDLVTSTIKRDLGIKDWSKALPGHGGILDRLNSLVYTAPMVFHLIVFWKGL